MSEASHGRSVMMLRPLLRSDLAELERAAAEDGHAVVEATHVFVKDGAVVGYVSMRHHVCLANVWVSSTAAQALDSLCGLKAIEAVAAEHGNQGLVMPCHASSPYYPKMEKLGFDTVQEGSVNVKRLI